MEKTLPEDPCAAAVASKQNVNHEQMLYTHPDPAQAEKLRWETTKIGLRKSHDCPMRTMYRMPLQQSRKLGFTYDARGINA